jgi:endonuclease III
MPNLSSQKIFDILSLHYEPRCALHYTNAWEILVAVRLSAQCTDVAVNKATERLFLEKKSIKEYAESSQEEMESYLKSLNYYKVKSESTRKAAQYILKNFNGEVPNTMDKLLELPGIGRKTANVILGTYFRKPVGVVVDTHVGRITHHLGLTKNTDPVKIEQDLIKLFPKKQWIDLSHLLVWHGRKICIARNPRCEICPLSEVCEFYKK